jgi:hypothetical protein
MCPWCNYVKLDDVSFRGLRPSPLGTVATLWPIAPAPDDMWSNRWNENWQGKLKYSEKTCTSVTLSTTNPIWPELEDTKTKETESGPDEAHLIVKIICFLLNIIINKDNVNENILESEGVHRVDRSVADKSISNFWFMTGLWRCQDSWSCAASNWRHFFSDKPRSMISCKTT